jgi:osmotically-inducible protein OsmY
MLFFPKRLGDDALAKKCKEIRISPMEQVSLTRRIEQQLAQEGIHATVEEVDSVIRLSGIVDSADARDAAEAVAIRIASDRQIENNLAVAPGAPRDMAAPAAGGPEAGDLPLDVAEAEEGVELDPGFTDQPLETNIMDAMNPDAPDDEPPAEPDTTFFPPTDPVVGRNDQGLLEVIGGFAPTSLSDSGVRPSAEDNVPGDEALAEAVRRELREDASTTDLRIRVIVRRGVVHLRGAVPALQDAENAEAVASSVPGIREVIDELDVPGL